jgi:excinuclease ABC subunit A
MANPKSLTGKYLSGEMSVPVPAERRKPKKPHASRSSARAATTSRTSRPKSRSAVHRVTGVSGGGKSTFLIETLYKARRAQAHGRARRRRPHDRIEGLEHIDKVIDIDQSPIGRTPRSNPATYTGAFTPIRDWFAGLPEAKARGYQPGRFSFNVKGGRCEACQGDGVIKIEMHFLPDVYVTCDVCKGKRYNRETLEVLFKGKSIADVLDMTVEEGVEFFKAVPACATSCRRCKASASATSRSASRRRRCRAARRSASSSPRNCRSKRATGRTLYILDEPTTGLHFHDVAKLLEVLHELVDQGNTVVVIEHNLEVIKTADWVIDLGPEGGDGGGEGYLRATIALRRQ